MSDIEAQLELERGMMQRGAASYVASQRKAEDNGRGAELDYSRKLMQNFVLPLVEALKTTLDKVQPGRYGKARSLLRRVSPERAIFIAMKGMFNSFTMDQPIASTASGIGRVVEDEVRFSRFEELHGDYYATIIADFKRKGTKDYRYMHRVLTNSANSKADNWITWTPTERVLVGMHLLDLIMTNTDLCERKTLYIKKRQHVLLVPTAEAQEWIQDHEAMRQFMYPDRAPCIIEPDQWTALDQGGYYSPDMRSTTPMVKVSGHRQRKLLEKADLSAVMEALNIVQNVEWQVNPDILNIMRAVWHNNLRIGMPPSEKITPGPCPIEGIKKEDMTEAQRAKFIDWKREAAELYTQEKDRVSKTFQVTRIMRIATDYSFHSGFWYVWYADFRGRLYTSTAGFSPQGPDLAKGLLRFAKGKALGPRGLYWLKVHCANRYGYDKTSYDDRVAWVDQRQAEFLQAAHDPLSHRGVWADADKPWQFLAALFELRGVYEAKALGIPEAEYVSRLPIGLDGSCNGLQNFSAMLRDPVGGAATNLVPGDKPADIYSQVAGVCYDRLVQKHDDPLAEAWIMFCAKESDSGVAPTIPRSLAKRPVMTLPYGATRQSCTKYIFQSILDLDRQHFVDGNFAAACWLTPVLWESIGSVVVAAREAMDWLQSAASAMTKADLPITWTTPDGFVAVQHSRVIETVQIRTQLNGTFKIRVGNHTDKLDGAKQRQGISPNFVHSMDATHLRTTVRLARARGITNMALIHDDYGTHAGDTDLLHACIREAFVLIYTRTDPLAAFRAEQEAAGGLMPPLPAKGSLDIEAVRASLYFFG